MRKQFWTLAVCLWATLCIGLVAGDMGDELLGFWSESVNHPAPIQNQGTCCLPDNITITRNNSASLRAVIRFSTTNLGCQGRSTTPGEKEFFIIYPWNISVCYGDLGIFPGDSKTARLYWHVQKKSLLDYLSATVGDDERGGCGFYMLKHITDMKDTTALQQELTTESTNILTPTDSLLTPSTTDLSKRADSTDEKLTQIQIYILITLGLQILALIGYAVHFYGKISPNFVNVISITRSKKKSRLTGFL